MTKKKLTEDEMRKHHNNIKCLSISDIEEFIDLNSFKSFVDRRERVLIFSDALMKCLRVKAVENQQDINMSKKDNAVKN